MKSYAYALLVAGSLSCFAQAPVAPVVAKGDLYVLTIGVEPKLTNRGKNDPYARDAGHIAESLAAAKPFYQQIHRTVLGGAEATPAAVTNALRRITGKVGANDVLFVHFSTHGNWEAKGGFTFSLIGQKPPPVWAELDGREVVRMLGAIPGRAILSLDTCAAEGIIPAQPKNVTPRVSYLVACGKQESSVGNGDSVKRPHGVYVAAFCEALAGRADTNRDGTVTWGEVVDWLPQRTAGVNPEQHAAFRLPPDMRNLPLGKVESAPIATGSPGKPPLIAEGARNPFGLPDVEHPFGPAVKEFIQGTRLAGSDADENAPAWTAVAAPGAASIDGQWASRWKDTGDWTTGRATIRTKGDRIYILYRDSGGRYLFELRYGQGNTQRLVGRYVNLGDEDDNGPWVGRIIGNDRIDGKWNGGRWDFRRVATPAP